MRMRNLNLIVKGCMLIMLCFSCKKEDTYQVEAELDPYLQMFLQEGAKRGFNFNVEENGLLMKFADLQAPTIGLCTYSEPLLVQIDRTYWQEVTKYENCEDLRQNVVFHELAHGLLNRDHDNGILTNGEWKSLMCGGDTYLERSWQVNFCGERRQYYLDELFNPSMPQPEWANYGDSFSGEKGSLYYELDLNNPKAKTDEDGNSFTISDGLYTVYLNSESNTILPIGKEEQVTGDCYFEATLYTHMSNVNACIGVGVEYTDAHNQKAYNSFLISKNYMYNEYRAYPANTKCQPNFAEVSIRYGVCDVNNETKLSIERTGNEYYFYVNDQLIYRHDYDADKPINRFNLIIPGKTETYVTSFKCYKKTEASIKSSSVNKDFFWGEMAGTVQTYKNVEIK